MPGTFHDKKTEEIDLKVDRGAHVIVAIFWNK